MEGINRAHSATTWLQRMAHWDMVEHREPRTSEELASWLRLAAEPELSRANATQLLKAMGLPQQIFSSSVSALGRLLPRELAIRLAAPAEAEVQAAVDKALHLLAQPGHHLLTLADESYPASLFDTGDPPIVLYIRGNPQLLRQPSVAIVGARNATEGGKDNARAFARHLAGRGWVITSGLARGIDAAAHEGALQAGASGGGTIAVLACGLDITYPRQNAALAEAIAVDGALITEYPPGAPALPFRFPDRNRLVAALARGLLVVEAASQSGSLGTARLAAEYGREVFAIPGSIHAPLSRGCHALIRQGAKLVEQGRDIEEELTRTGAIPPALEKEAGAVRPRAARHRSTSDASSHNLAFAFNEPTDSAPSQPSRGAGRMLKDPTVGRVLTALGYDPASADLLCRRSGLDFSRVAAILTELELNDIVQRQDDGRYVRRQQGII